MREARQQRALDIVISVIAIIMVLYHLVSVQYLLLGPIPHQNLHLAFALVLVFLGTLQKKPRLWPWNITLVLVSLIATAYVHIFYYDLELRSGFPTTADTIIGTILIIVVIESTRQAWGIVLPILASFFIAYSFLGYLLPPPFYFMKLQPEQIVSNMGIGMRGMYGSVLSISANYIFMFVLFGSVLGASGATGFFMEIGRVMGRRFRAGSGMSAVVTSALVGMVSGSVVVNVVTTGSFTIPLMKKVGYKPEHAGAIEAAASTGGQIMPPVMGIAAFAMAVFTETSYMKICAMAAIPAVLYFLVCGLYVYLQAERLNINPTTEKSDISELVKRAPLFILPLLLLVVLLVMGHSAEYCAFWAIVALVALSIIRRKTRPPLSQWIRGFVDGAATGAQIGVSVACIGTLIAVVVTTGLGIKISALVEAWSGGHLIVALLITMLVSILLGMGVPTFTAYVLVATISAPVLIKMGLSMIIAHFFVFYFACFSFVTPPVAIGALVASRLAKSGYMKTGLEASKVAMGGFLVPYAIVYYPALTLGPTETHLILSGLLALLAGLFAIEIALVGQFLTRLHLTDRIIFFVIGALFVGFVIIQNYILFVAGAVLSAFLVFWGCRNKKLLDQLVNSKATPTSI